MSDSQEYQATDSLWIKTVSMPRTASLKKPIDTEVCVIGAGIAGLSTAYMLAKEGRKVVVLDDGSIAGGQTQVTTAHLASAVDDRFVEIERMHGEEGARLVAESHASAINRIETIVHDEQIKCDFYRVDGYLFQGDKTNHDDDLLDRELEAARRTGVMIVDRVPHAPIPGFDTGPCLCFARQAQFHPLKYLAGIARAILREGGEIYTKTHATHIIGGEKAVVETENGPTVTADHAVVCTNTPINDLVAIHTKQAAYISYVVAAPVPAGTVPRALYWDTLDPYHYVRLQSIMRGGAGERHKMDMLIVGGEDHKTGQANDGAERFHRLETWARERFPMMQEVVLRWSGQVFEPVDGVAFIGRNPLDTKNIYIATGDSGMGMTHGTIAGMLITDLIQQRENRWEKLYDPSRRTLSALGEYARENVNLAMQYGQWLTPGEINSPEELVPGQGAIIRRGLTKAAVFCDPDGELIEMSAMCPHLGCVVSWNGTEQTWDCPCHGSRFTAKGKVINGPANADLEVWSVQRHDVHAHSASH